MPRCVLDNTPTPTWLLLPPYLSHYLISANAVCCNFIVLRVKLPNVIVVHETGRHYAVVKHERRFGQFREARPAVFKPLLVICSNVPLNAACGFSK
jgi:hypothetical protein